MNHKIEFHLKELMEKKGYSKSRLCREANLRFETVQGYYLGNITRIDLFVLTQFCEILSCKVEDIITYNPKKKS
ncbi:MAG: helix-turn-helix transcriptional regulator [Bacilli bacterium]|nr:helix-turn-helix transcriptional regulator [Bacilli bacterium]MBR1817913.1 helix-turn-helix transcriptional regulator [Bacilli bacterium]